MADVAALQARIASLEAQLAERTAQVEQLTATLQLANAELDAYRASGTPGGGAAAGKSSPLPPKPNRVPPPPPILASGITTAGASAARAASPLIPPPPPLLASSSVSSTSTTPEPPAVLPPPPPSAAFTARLGRSMPALSPPPSLAQLALPPPVPPPPITVRSPSVLSPLVPTASAPAAPSPRAESHTPLAAVPSPTVTPASPALVSAPPASVGAGPRIPSPMLPRPIITTPTPLGSAEFTSGSSGSVNLPLPATAGAGAGADADEAERVEVRSPAPGAVQEPEKRLAQFLDPADVALALINEDSIEPRVADEPERPMKRVPSVEEVEQALATPTSAPSSAYPEWVLYNWVRPPQPGVSPTDPNILNKPPLLRVRPRKLPHPSWPSLPPALTLTGVTHAWRLHPRRSPRTTLASRARSAAACRAKSSTSSCSSWCAWPTATASSARCWRAPSRTKSPMRVRLRAQARGWACRIAVLLTPVASRRRRVASLGLAESATTLFRSNSVASRVISVYFRMAGKAYLHATLKPVLTHLRAMGDLEVDPSKETVPERQRQNMNKLKSTTGFAFRAIVGSADACPPCVRCLRVVGGTRPRAKRACGLPPPGAAPFPQDAAAHLLPAPGRDRVAVPGAWLDRNRQLSVPAVPGGRHCGARSLWPHARYARTCLGQTWQGVN